LNCCPPNKDDPFWNRIIKRFLFLLQIIFCWPYCRFKQKWFSIPLALSMAMLLAIPLIAVCLIYDLLILGVKFMKVLTLILLTLVTIVIPVYVFSSKPQWLNPLTDILLRGLPPILSFLAGSVIHERKIKKEATAKWMPAAESACKELITISSTVARLQKNQSNLCSQIESFLTNAVNNSAQLRSLLENKCQSCSNQLLTVKNHIDKSTEDWIVFLTHNCEKGECDQIFKRIDDMKKSLCREQSFNSKSSLG
jgi:predicted transcriptional regulator